MTTVNSFPLETVAASTILPPVQWTYSSTITDTDPGDGKFRLNNATPASATAAYIDNEEIGGTDVSDWLDTFDDGGASTKRGTLTITATSDTSIFYIFNVTDSVVDGTGYRKLTIAYIAGGGVLTDGHTFTVSFTPRTATIIDDDTMATATSTNVASAESTKAYVDAPQVATRAALKALSGTVHPTAYLREAGREGVFVWDSSDLSSTLLGSAITTTSVDTTTVISTAHGLVTGYPVIVTSSVDGLSTNTLYYVILVGANTFKLATSLADAVAGTPITFTGTTNFTVKRHFDTQEGVYVCPADDITGASGAWVRARAIDLELSWFGAIGDGDADNADADSTAITAALDLIDKRGGGRVHAPAGTYRVGGSGSASSGTCILLPSNVTLYGDGIGKTIFKQIAASSRHIISMSGAINVILRDFEVDADRDNQTISGHSGIRIGDNGVDGLWIHRVKVSQTEAYGITQSGDSDSASCKHVWYHQCWVENTGSDCYDFHNRGSEADDGNDIILVTDCYAKNPGINGIAQHDLTCFDFRGVVLASGLRCDLGDAPEAVFGSTKRGIRFREDSTSGQIGGNKSSLSNFTIIGSGDDSTSGIDIPADDVTVSNGYIENVQQGIVVLGKRASIENVNIQEVTLKGIAAGSSGTLVADRLRITGCNIRNSTLTASTIGIQVNTADDVQIHGCQIDTFPVGAQIESGSADTEFVGNKFFSCTTDISNSGTRTRGKFLTDYGHRSTTGVDAAATIDLDSNGADFQTVTGTENISAVTLDDGRRVTVLFTGTPTLVVSSTLVRNKGNADDYVVTAGELVQFLGHSGKVYFAPFGAPYIFWFALSDETTAITTGTNKATFSLPFAFTVTGVYATLNTASSSGAVTVDINEAGTSILSTKLTIDANEKTSATAATAAVISDASIAANAEFGFDIDGAGTGAKGLKVFVTGHRT